MTIFINCLVAQLLKIKKKKKDTQISQIGYYYFMNIMKIRTLTYYDVLISIRIV